MIKKLFTIITTIILILGIVFIFSNKNMSYANENLEKTEFRAAWISYYTGDLNYKNAEDYKNQIDKILDTLEYYNMNAMIFHVRSNHDAWYKSSINKVNAQLENVDFDKFDPLEYVITEAHKRGIEFHAWLNPYRIGSVYKTKEAIAEAYKNYKMNPASSVDNILMGSSLQILDPGIPEVREFIVETCLELASNYDIDAIHFDDYFYASGINDTSTYNKYNTKNLSISDFRREQVDIFIKNLKDALDKFNNENSRYVQLGISPTGVYKNANSDAEAKTKLSDYRYDASGNLVYPIGATTGCQMHYESYLYCDTLKWVNNEWINYILPQTYWSTSHSRAPFERLINWWNMAVKNKNVNLYAGMGLYMWPSTNSEALTQINITDGLENVLGTSIYSYREIAKAYNKTDPYLVNQMTKVKNSKWNRFVLAPTVKGFDEVELESVKNFIIEGNTLSWSRNNQAKFYVVYRSVGAFSYTNDEIVDIIGSDNDIITWQDNITGNYIYDVRPLSYTNTLGDVTKKAVNYIPSTTELRIANDLQRTDLIDKNISYNVKQNKTLFVSITDKYSQTVTQSYDWVSTDPFVATIDATGAIITKNIGTTEIIGTSKVDSSDIAKCYINVYEGTLQTHRVKFINPDGSILKEEDVLHGSSAVAPTNNTLESTNKYTFEFIGWDTLFNNVTTDLQIYAIYKGELQKLKVIFKNLDGTVLKEELVKYGHSATPPKKPTMPKTIEHTYIFSEWDKDYSYITNDTEIYARYKTNDNLYVVTFVDGFGNENTNYYYYYEDINRPLDPVYENNYKFLGWYEDEFFENEVKFPFKPTKNMKIYPKFEECFEIKIYDESSKLIKVYTESKDTLVRLPIAKQIDGYKFIGYTDDVTVENIVATDEIIACNISLYPVYKKLYTITFYDIDGNIISEQRVTSQTEIVLPTLEECYGYRFIGWDKEIDEMNCDMEVYPEYEIVSNKKNCKNANIIVFFSAYSLIVIAYLLKRKKY